MKNLTKLDLNILNGLSNKPDGKLILVSVMTATSAQDGKTCISVGLTQALGKLKKTVIMCLREFSLGSTFELKSGKAWGNSCTGNHTLFREKELWI